MVRVSQTICRLTLPWISIALVGAAIGEPEPAKTKQFSSTLCGFSLEYPAFWIKEGPVFCGNELMGLTKSDRDRKLWPVVYLYSEPSTEQQPLRPCIHVMYQAVRSEAERKSDEAISEDQRMTKFTTSQGLIGYKLVEQAKPGGPSPVSSIHYWFPHHGRLLLLMCMDGGRGLKDWEPIFDTVMKSTILTEPFSDNAEGKPKTFQKGCASVSYPRNWSRAVSSSDDEKDGYRFEAPHAEKKETATMQLLFEDKTLGLYEEESRKSLSANSHWFEIVPFENGNGQKGLRVAAEIGFGKTNKTTWFVLPCSDGRLAVLFCWDHDNDDVDWTPIFAEIAKSLTVE